MGAGLIIEHLTIGHEGQTGMGHISNNFHIRPQTEKMGKLVVIAQWRPLRLHQNVSSQNKNGQSGVLRFESAQISRTSYPDNLSYLWPD